jgi:hypothetical protein
MPPEEPAASTRESAMPFKPEDTPQQSPQLPSRGTGEGGSAGEARYEGELERAPLRILNQQELKAASDVGGVGLQGFGVLQGQLKFLHRSLRVILITANAETRSEVVFLTDLPPDAVSASASRRVAVSGLIRKESPHNGTLTGACVVGKSTMDRKPGQYLVLEGMIENRHPMAIGGEAPPSGSWLLFPSPIHIGKFLAREVYLVDKLLPAGTKVLLYGRLGLQEYGGVETPRGAYATLSGISDLAAGEPFYDGQQFWRQESDEPLRMLLLDRAHLVDAPSRVLVLDEARLLAHVGTWGGLQPVSSSLFHGFYAKAAIEHPTDAELAAIRFDAQHKPVDVATGEPLRELGLGGPETPHADAMYTAYYWNEHTETVYVMLNGGIAGFRNHVQWVIHVPRRET